MYRKKPLFKILILLALIGASAFFMSSCGGGSVSAPPDATITINPETLPPVTDVASELTLHKQNFTIYVQNSKGDPLGDIEIWISYRWEVAPDSVGAVQLYDGDTPVNSPFEAKTKNNGIYDLLFDFQSGGGLNYKGVLEVRSGSAFNSVTFEVTTGGG